jgi:hypothetical protein
MAHAEDTIVDIKFDINMSQLVTVSSGSNNRRLTGRTKIWDYNNNTNRFHLRQLLKTGNVISLDVAPDLSIIIVNTMSNFI